MQPHRDTDDGTNQPHANHARWYTPASAAPDKAEPADSNNK
jgi:hypothetical protein